MRQQGSMLAKFMRSRCLSVRLHYITSGIREVFDLI
jgi:hypothetical protein